MSASPDAVANSTPNIPAPTARPNASLRATMRRCSSSETPSICTCTLKPPSIGSTLRVWGMGVLHPVVTTSAASAHHKGSLRHDRLYMFVCTLA